MASGGSMIHIPHVYWVHFPIIVCYCFVLLIFKKQIRLLESDLLNF